MPYELIHHGLLSVPSEDSPKPGIYWLRLLRENVHCVAILTEVPLNPGYSMSLNVPNIKNHIERAFSLDVDNLTFYRVLSRGYPDPAAAVIYTKEGWTSRDGLEASVGLQLPGLPENGELRKRVIELGGSETEYVRRQVFEAVPVTELPYPFNPYQCKHYDRFRAIENEATAPSRWDHDRDEVSREFISSLATDDVNACWYHKANWAAIADESIRVVEVVGKLKPDGYYKEEARKSALGKEDLKWLVSLFEHPVIISGGGYTDGQHRGCALRFSGASQAAVVTSHERVVTRKNDWQYAGDG
jgi:hypothetical protein